MTKETNIADMFSIDDMETFLRRAGFDLIRERGTTTVVEVRGFRRPPYKSIPEAFNAEFINYITSYRLLL